MAEVISFADMVRARRRSREEKCTAACVWIIETNLQLLARLFASGPVAERPVRTRQVRQLAEVLEYIRERS